jgi:hypothetical protein
MIDFNTEPYNDDFSEDKNFHRILFRPSFAVQARELTQLQTILQKQIQRHGDHIFKNGAMVVPGQVSVDTEADYIKLQSVYSGVAVETFLTSLLGKRLVGSNGVIAEVIKTQSQEETDPTTLYVKYVTSGTNNTTKTFVADEVLTTEDGEYSVQIQPSTSTPVGIGSLVSIERGIYYVNGHFVLVGAQTTVLDKYSNTPTYRIGLVVDEGVITPEQDETLLDNAQNSFNFAAPGSHRYYIELTLSKIAITDTDDQDFVELMQIIDGRVLTHVTTTNYAELEKTLARRTFDESGDYVVKDFNIDVREHRTNDRGTWTATTSFLIGDIVTNAGNKYVAKNSGSSVSIAPTHTSGTAFDGPGSTGIQWEYTLTPSYNRGIFLSGSEDKLAIGMEPGKAYVRGYELEKIGTEYVIIDKARAFDQADNSFIFANVGNFVYVTNLNNLPPVNTFGTVNLYDRLTGTASRGTAVGNKIGTARVRFIEWDSGTLGATTALYKLSLFDIKLDQGKTFDRNVKSFHFSGGSAALSFSADISPQDLAQNQLIGSITISTTTV